MKISIRRNLAATSSNPTLTTMAQELGIMPVLGMENSDEASDFVQFAAWERHVTGRFGSKTWTTKARQTCVRLCGRSGTSGTAQGLFATHGRGLH